MSVQRKTRNGARIIDAARRIRDYKPPNPANTQNTKATTNSSGLYTWTFPTPYATGVFPNVQATVEGGVLATSYTIKCTSVNETTAAFKVLPAAILTINLLAMEPS